MRKILAPALLLALALTACSPSVAPPTGATTTVRVGSLKGPTTMGLVNLMDRAGKGQTTQPYTFSVQGTPDAVSVPLVAGQLDIALIPINLAAVLFNQTSGSVQLAAVNTLGVLYVVSNDPAVLQLSDLGGRTVLNTGQGTTPQFVIDKVLSGNGLTSSVTVDYRSQATEVASVLATTPNSIAVLPEPYVTAALAADPNAHIVADLNTQWQSLTGSPLVTSCVVVAKSFSDSHAAEVANFLADYAASVQFVNDNPAAAAPLIVAQGLAPNTQVAENAIPRAHIVFMTGSDAKQAVIAYLTVLHTADPKSVGGAIPGDSFFYNA